MEHFDMATHSKMESIMKSFDIFRCRRHTNDVINYPLQEITEKDLQFHKSVVQVSYIAPGNVQTNDEMVWKSKRSILNSYHIETKYFISETDFTRIFHEARYACQPLKDRLLDIPVSNHLKVVAKYPPGPVVTLGIRLVEGQQINP
jgi:hypothetical protein